MPVLDNPRHELFAQAIAKGVEQRLAYRSAGYAEESTDDVVDAAASRLLSDVRVETRVKEIQANGAKRTEITVERVLLELAKVGFSDLRKAARWQNGIQVIEEGDAPTLASNVLVVPSDEIDDDTAAAVSEISQGPNGVRIKMHDKLGALEKIGKHLAMFTDKSIVGGDPKTPLEVNVNHRLPESAERALTELSGSAKAGSAKTPLPD